MRNPVFQALTLYASSRQSVGQLTVFTGLHGRNTYNCGPCGMQGLKCSGLRGMKHTLM